MVMMQELTILVCMYIHIIGVHDVDGVGVHDAFITGVHYGEDVKMHDVVSAGVHYADDAEVFDACTTRVHYANMMWEFIRAGVHDVMMHEC